MPIICIPCPQCAGSGVCDLFGGRGDVCDLCDGTTTVIAVNVDEQEGEE